MAYELYVAGEVSTSGYRWRATVLGLLTFACGCDGPENTARDLASAPADVPKHPAKPVAAQLANTSSAQPGTKVQRRRPTPSPQPETTDPQRTADAQLRKEQTPDASPAALELRLARRAKMVYASADFGAAFRGKIPTGEVFEVFAHVTGDARCRKPGWARVGPAAFACMQHTVISELAPRDLPVVGGNGLTPYYYARRKKNGDEAGRWRSRTALRRGDDPESFLEDDHDYAFTRRRRTRGGALLIDHTRRTIRERDVRRLKPSTFAGRDLVEHPLPEHQVLAWVYRWPGADLRERPSDRTPKALVPHHSQVMVAPDPVRHRGHNYYALTGASQVEYGDRWVRADQIRRFIGFERPEQVSEDETWLDIELTQQTLSIVHGDTPIFVTLVSSGSYRHASPQGIFRLTSKQALGDMRSRAQDDDSYYVEDVPWIQYFKGRYALHAAFWHNRFGIPVSHGCVNLSPKDALRVFAATLPSMPQGWLTIYETAQDLGTLVRLRRGHNHVEDRRRPPTLRHAK